MGVASRIAVTIAASDDAHGVFQFSPESLSVNGTEPEDGHSSVLLKVSVQHYWKIRTFPVIVYLMFFVLIFSFPGG